jgi:NADH:ubiquinone oxidoreductase subunit K
MTFAWLDLVVLMLLTVVISLTFSSNNILNILVLAELIWILTYVYASMLSVSYDSIFVFVSGVYVLILATGETTVGISILILRMNLFGSISINDTLKTKNNFYFRKKFNTLINSKITNDK